MLEIKFKAKTVLSDEWVCGHYAFVDGYHVIYEDGKPLIIKLNTLFAYTNLKDVKQRDIYDGDYFYVDGEIRIIRFACGSFWTHDRNWNQKELLYSHIKHVEIAGNYFEDITILD